jgi:hypothetical protein
MSVPVELHALQARIEEYGTVAFLVTVGSEGTAHVSSVEVALDGDHLVVPTGRTSRTNLGVNPQLTLVWSPRPDPAYSMIVDAVLVTVADDGTHATVAPQSAVLHRVAGAAGDGPNCAPVDQPPPSA